ncbi:MAG: hypothetical protein IJ946_06820 [Clostridia bacterium]|nr:hypothetical protein [Clostridia bacterium]
MEEKTEITPDKANRATTPTGEPLIPVKFNKEIRQLTLDEASALSQKGMKYDAVKEQWERLKALAGEEKVSPKEFLDALEKRRTEKRIEELTKECGGNREMAERIVCLEKGQADLTLKDKDFCEYFPNMQVTDLPDEVLISAKENNSDLLNEYLRFMARKSIEAKAQERLLKANAKSTVGSQKDSGINRSPEEAEFVRGIWNK